MSYSCSPVREHYDPYLSFILALQFQTTTSVILKNLCTKAMKEFLEENRSHAL